MLTASNLGIIVAILSVLMSYYVGYSHGHAAGRDRGYDDGKRDGSKEGSMRGYAVGYDRAKRLSDREHEPTVAGGVGFGVVALLIAIAGIFILAASGSQSRNAKRPAADARPAIQAGSEFPARFGSPPPRDTWRERTP